MSSILALKGGSPVRREPFHRWPVSTAADEARLLAVLRSGKWSFDGPVEQEFSQKFGEHCGAKHTLCVANGSVSLSIALRALGVKAGDEVIVPALTWIATAWSAIDVGATPVFADVREEDWCLDPVSVQQKITSRTRAIIPVHLYSQMAEMDALLAIARKHSLAIIEDCAHAHGFQWNGRGAGTIGDVGSYSFQQSKVMTAGEGGALVTNRDDLADKMYAMKNCGRKRAPQSSFGFGTNHRLTDFQAAVLLGQLERLDEQLLTKTINVGLFRRAIEQVPGVHVLAPKPAVTRHGLYGLSLRCDPEAFAGVPIELIIEALNAEGVPVHRPYDVVYKSPMWMAGEKTSNLENPRKRLGLDSSCPRAERISREGIVVPHHIFLGTQTDVADLAAAFAKVQQHASELKLDAMQRRIRHAGGELLRKVALLS